MEGRMLRVGKPGDRYFIPAKFSKKGNTDARWLLAAKRMGAVIQVRRTFMFDPSTEKVERLCEIMIVKACDPPKKKGRKPGVPNRAKSS